MKLSCLMFRPWLIPYASGTLETDRPSLAGRIARHIADCIDCRTEAARMQSSDAILRGYGARTRVGRDREMDISGTQRGKLMTPLSSRVLASIQSDEKFHSSARWSPNGLSFVTAAIAVVAFVTIMNPMLGAKWVGSIFGGHTPHPVKTSPARPGVPYYAPVPNPDPMAPQPPKMTAPAPGSAPADAGNTILFGGESGFFNPSPAQHSTASPATPAPSLPRLDSPQGSTAAPPSSTISDQGNTDAISAQTNTPAGDSSQTNGNVNVPSAPPSPPVLPTVGGDSSMPSFDATQQTAAPPQSSLALVKASNMGGGDLPPGPPLPGPTQTKPPCPPPTTNLCPTSAPTASK